MKVIRHAGVVSGMIILDDNLVTLLYMLPPITAFFVGYGLHTMNEVTIGSNESFVGVLDRPK